MNSHEIFRDAQRILEQKGFIPYGAVKLGKRPNSEGLLFHEAIREVIGMKPDDSVYMYWEWKQLKLALNAMWVDLDQAASSLAGRPTTSIAHVFEDSVGLKQLDPLFAVALENSPPIEFPRVSRRPSKSESSIRFVGKMTGALLTTLGVIEESRKSGYGDLFSSLTDRPRTNEELLDHLDSMCRAINPSLELNAPKSIVILRALGKAFEDSNKQRSKEDLRELSLSEFFIETEESANWAGLSDSVVLKRFLAISPEDADAALKAIQKFLGE